MSRPCHVLRVFTRDDEGGNHLGVINDVVGLSEEKKQKIATELGFSETIYIDWTDPETDPSVQIFTPVQELPFAGHPLVGAAWVLAALGPKPAQALRTNVGSFSCEANMTGAAVSASVEMTELEGDVALLALQAEMPAPDRSILLGLPLEYYIARFATAQDVADLDPDMDALSAVFGFCAFSRTGNEVKMRFFAPGDGVPEDPATGSAAMALAKTFSIWGEPRGSVTISQGDEIGHPSTIELSWTPDSITIGGSVRKDETILVD